MTTPTSPSIQYRALLQAVANRKEVCLRNAANPRSSKSEGWWRKDIPRPHTRSDGVPTRACADWHTASEQAITLAMTAVENAGASPRLTGAINALSKARDYVADHVEGITTQEPSESPVASRVIYEDGTKSAWMDAKYADDPLPDKWGREYAYTLPSAPSPASAPLREGFSDVAQALFGANAKPDIKDAIARIRDILRLCSQETDMPYSQISKIAATARNAIGILLTPVEDASGGDSAQRALVGAGRACYDALHQLSGLSVSHPHFWHQNFTDALHAYTAALDASGRGSPT